MQAMQTNKYYQSYLLRLWRDTDQDTWRVSLQEIATQELFLFPTLDELFLFLCKQTQTKTSVILGQPPKHSFKKEYEDENL